MANSCYYKLSLTNANIENETDQALKSTASHMTLHMDEELDLYEHIYLKSLTAEICLEDFLLSNLPSAFSHQECLELSMKIPKSIAHGNAVMTESIFQNRNDTICRIPGKDLITAEPQKAIDFMNQQIQSFTNQFIMFRYMESLLDTDCFKKSVLESPETSTNYLSPEAIALLVWYVEIAILTRQQYVATINTYLKEESTYTRPDHKLPAQTPTSFNKDSEAKVIEESSLFTKIAERTTVDKKIVKFDNFYDVDLSDENSVLEALKTVDTDIKSFLLESGFLTTINNVLTENSFDLLSTIRDNNITVLKQSEMIYNLLRIELRKANPSPNNGLSTFYHNEIIHINIDLAGKSQFILRPDLFLANDKSKFGMQFGPVASRTLGAQLKYEKKLLIGPLHSDTRVTPERIVLKRDAITTMNERLYSKISPLPQTLFIITDSIANDCKQASMWAKDTRFASYHTLAAYAVTPTDLETGCISRVNVTNIFQRINTNTVP